MDEFNIEQLEEASEFLSEGLELGLVACMPSCRCGGQWLIWGVEFGPNPEKDEIIALAVKM